MLLRVADDGSDYDLWEEAAAQPEALGLVTLDSGVWVRFREDDGIEIGSSKIGATDRRLLTDDDLAASWLLARLPGKVLCATGRRVYRMSTKPDGQRRKDPPSARPLERRRRRPSA